MTLRSGARTPTDELLLGILLAVSGVAVGSGLNSELGTVLSLLGLLVGGGTYLVSALSAAVNPEPPARGRSRSGTDGSGEPDTRGDS